MWKWFIVYRDGYGGFYTFSSSQRYGTLEQAKRGLRKELNSRHHKRRRERMFLYETSVREV